MKYLDKAEVHAISKVSTIIRSISLPYLFHTVHLYAEDSPGLRDLTAAYVRGRALCKNITELRLDYRQFLRDSDRNLLSTVGVISVTDANLLRRIQHEPMCRLTTLVLHHVTLVDAWFQVIFHAQTLRRLHLDRCWFEKSTTPFPPTNISELVLQHQHDAHKTDALVLFLAPRLEILEVDDVWVSALLVTYPRLRKYVVRIRKELDRVITETLRGFLIRTTTIEHLELGVVLPSSTVPLPARALPRLRMFDVALSDGFAATKLVAGPRAPLGTLRIRDELVRSHDLGSVGRFLDVPYAVCALQLAFRKHNVAELLAAQLDRGLPGVERLSLDIRANHVCLLGQGDLGLCRDCTVLDSVLIGASEFVHHVKAAGAIQIQDGDDDDDCSGRTCLHKLKKIDVDIDVDSIGTTSAQELDAWFRSAVLAACPALEEMHLRIWKANDRGVEEDRARLGRRFWARWCMRIDDGSWRYEWGFYLGV